MIFNNKVKHLVALVERETLMAGETYTRFALRKETGHGLPGSLAEDNLHVFFCWVNGAELQVNLFRIRNNPQNPLIKTLFRHVAPLGVLRFNKNGLSVC